MARYSFFGFGNFVSHVFCTITIAAFSGPELAAEPANPASQWRDGQGASRPNPAYVMVPDYHHATLMHLKAGRRGLRHPAQEGHLKADFMDMIKPDADALLSDRLVLLLLLHPLRKRPHDTAAPPCPFPLVPRPHLRQHQQVLHRPPVRTILLIARKAA